MQKRILNINSLVKSKRPQVQRYSYRLFVKKKGGNWYLELFRGKAFSLKTTDKNEAKLIRQAVIDEMRDGKIAVLEKSAHISLQDFAVEYLAAAEEMVSLGELRPNTARNDRYALRKFIDLIGGEMPLRHITRDTVKDFKRSYLAEHGNSERSMRGCNTYMRHLSTAWDFAIREKCDYAGMVVKPSYVDMNPFKSERGRRGERMKFKVTQRQPLPLLPEEITAIRATMYREFRRFIKNANNPELTQIQRKMATSYAEGVLDTDRIFLCMLFSGLRVAEQVRLQERDILFSLNAIKVRSPETMGHGIKDYEERHIAMHPRLKNMLLGMFPEGGKRVGISNFVFPRWSNTSSLSHRLSHFFRLAGVGKPPKSTRHSFASYRIASGADIALLQREMGHSDMATTQRYIGALRSLKEGVHGQNYVAMMEKACRAFKQA